VFHISVPIGLSIDNKVTVLDKNKKLMC